MDKSLSSNPRYLNKLAWVLVPLLLMVAAAVGGWSIFSAHAASSLNGSYSFRAITTAGPSIGTYITGNLFLSVDSSNNITGNVCGLSINHSHCTAVTGTTPDGVKVSLTLRHTGGFQDISLTGAFQAKSGNHGGFDGFAGTFSFGGQKGVSTGTWEARVGNPPPLVGTWTFYASVSTGPDNKKQYHGILSLLQTPNGQLTGTYCPSTAGAQCIAVTGGSLSTDPNFSFYINIVKTLRLRGSYAGGNHGSRISGQFETLDPNAPSADKGYWIGY